MRPSRKKKSRAKRAKAGKFIFLTVALASLLFLALFLLLRMRPEEKAVHRMPPPPSPVAKVPEEGTKEKEEKPPPLPRLALIIDDGGYSLEKFRAMMGMGRPITYAILPNTPHARKVALMAHEEGCEVMLHLPMEPKERENYSLEDHTILVGMSQEEIRAIVQKALEQIPNVRGVNNHMGSKATEDPGVMQALMEVLKKEGLYFVDSHTSPRSLGPQKARQAGVAFGSNDRFIDAEKDLEAIRNAIRLVMKKAKQEGKAIAIGHPHSLTAQAIREMIPEIEGAGIRLVFASEVVG